MLSRTVGLMVTTLMVSHAALARCDFTAPRTATLDMSGVRKVVLRTGAGDLSVRGLASATSVQARGDACADSQKRLDAIRIDLRRDGDTILIDTILGDDDSFFNHDSLDLTVELPAAAEVRLEDSSGDLSVAGIASVSVADSSGDQVIHDIGGNVVVTDSSGEIDIKNIRGNVEVSDSSGDVLITDMTGNATIPVDSSGDLVFRGVHGDVHIKTDSSGDISITDVNNDVKIDNDSSGSIRVADVGGSLTIEHDSSGRIDYRNVLGSVSVPRTKRDD